MAEKPLNIDEMRTPSNGKDKSPKEKEREDLMDQLTQMEQIKKPTKLDKEYIAHLKTRLNVKGGTRKSRKTRKTKRSKA